MEDRDFWEKYFHSFELQMKLAKEGSRPPNQSSPEQGIAKKDCQKETLADKISSEPSPPKQMEQVLPKKDLSQPKEELELLEEEGDLIINVELDDFGEFN